MFGNSQLALHNKVSKPQSLGCLSTDLAEWQTDDRGLKFCLGYQEYQACQLTGSEGHWINSKGDGGGGVGWGGGRGAVSIDLTWLQRKK